LQFKKTIQPSYDDYAASLRELLAAKSLENFPRLIVVSGPSAYLHVKTFDAVKSLWEKLGVGAVHSLECSDLDQREFLAMVSQSSLFEPASLYVLRRASAVKNFGSWLSMIADLSSLRSYLVVDAGEKITPDLQKQLTRLGAIKVPCFEPIGALGYRKFVIALSKRHQLNLADDAITAIIEATGLDLAKIENEVLKLSLQFSGLARLLTKADVIPALGILREDDVFELFRFLRERQLAKAHLMSECFLNRGESAIAITGIFARFAREQIERGSLRSGLAGLHACAEADRHLKTSSIDEAIALSSVIEALAEV
jgi:DNA polymerase III delta subunit